MKSIDDHIITQIENKPKGEIFFTEDFLDFGSDNAIRVALHRLVKKGILERIARGMFVMPKISKFLNSEVGTSLDQVAKAVARRDRAKIVPTGSFALNALGLSTQVPLNAVYYTDGKARKLKIGKRTITFKKANPRKLSYKGKISGLVVLALSEIGKGKVYEHEKKKILVILQEEILDDLKHDIQLAPQWIAEIMSESFRK
jgi:hypothetical protein